ncbi:MAG: EAL domain-containing protein [Pseudomonadales bacterium]|nr:EAL domain-containing protein [Pseudomonadales bacterium]
MTEPLRRLSLLGIIGSIILAIFAAAVTVSFLSVRELVLDQTDQQRVDAMQARLHATQGTLQRFLLLEHPDGIRKVLSGFGPDLDLVAAFVTTSDGRVMASTRNRDVGRHWSELGYPIDETLALQVTTRQTSETVIDRAGQTLTGYISVCDPAANARLRARDCGFLMHRIDLGHHHAAAVESLYRQAFATAGVFGLGALIVMILLHRVVSRRVGRIISGLERFSGGDRASRIGLNGRDELAAIGQTADRILQELVEDEDALRASEQFNRAIIDSANSAVICVDTSGIISFFSAGAERMLGYRADEVIGRASPEIFHEPAELRARTLAFIAKYELDVEPGVRVLGLAARDELAYEDEWTFVRKDGSLVLVHLSISVIRDKRGEVSSFVALARDVTQEKGMVARVRLAEQVFENVGEAIVVTDAGLRVLDVNPAFLRMTGFSRADVIGRRYDAGGSGRHDRRFFVALWRQVRRVGIWSGEIWGRRRNGELFPQWLTISAIRDDRDRISSYVANFKDITSQKAAEEELERMAYYDPLTSLPNRSLLKDRLQHEISIAARRGTRLALLFIDLDRFKYVNDTLGHDAGDRLLVEAAARIRRVVRQSDTLARLGGDEFTLVMTDVEDPTLVAHVAQRIIDAMEEVFSVDGRDVFIGASIGIGMYPADGDSVLTLIKNADTAMYLAKQAGRGNYQFFTGELNARNERRMTLEASLRRAIDNDEFVLHYQPKVDMLTGVVTGFEALLRWQHPTLGLIPPGDFVPLAEEARLILPMGQWVLEQACAQLRDWHGQGFTGLRMSVNLSARQFQADTLVDDIAELLTRLGLPADRLDLELTESLLMADAERALAVMRRLRELGVTLSVDDFGMGYSSLSYLKKFPIDTLKIDREFVSGVVNDAEDAGIVRAIISLARTMQLQVVAEGVEDVAQEQFLLREGCELAQGYLYGRPLAVADVEAFLLASPGGARSNVVPLRQLPN